MWLFNWLQKTEYNYVVDRDSQTITNKYLCDISMYYDDKESIHVSMYATSNQIVKLESIQSTLISWLLILKNTS
jgi:hypothetical protein